MSMDWQTTPLIITRTHPRSFTHAGMATSPCESDLATDVTLHKCSIGRRVTPSSRGSCEVTVILGATGHVTPRHNFRKHRDTTGLSCTFSSQSTLSVNVRDGDGLGFSPRNIFALGSHTYVERQIREN